MLNEDSVAALSGVSHAFVAVDIGGTNTRVSVGTMRASFVLSKFRASSKSALLAALHSVGTQLRSALPRLVVLGAAVALAGPVLEGGRACAVTNYEGPDRRLETRDFEKTGLCGTEPGRVVLLNDLEATCFGLIALEHPSSHLKLEHFFDTLWAPDAAQRPALHVEKKFCVLAVGTGLGSAAIMWNSASKNFTVVPLEAGHSFVQAYGPSHPGFKEEEKLFKFLSEKNFEGKFAPEFESFASGKVER